MEAGVNSKKECSRLNFLNYAQSSNHMSVSKSGRGEYSGALLAGRDTCPCVLWDNK